MSVKVAPSGRLARYTTPAKAVIPTVLASWRQGQILAAHSGHDSQRAASLLIPIYRSATDCCALDLLGVSLSPG